MTHVAVAKPTKAFGKLLHFMTMGLGSEKEERETFTAVSVLQKFNRAFSSLGITDIVRLAKDEINYYLDEEGKEDDLKEAMDAFASRTAATPASQRAFESLKLVLEHPTENLIYLIEVEIKRRHRVGEVPIKVIVNGLISELKTAEESQDDVRAKLTPHFSSQDAYDSLVNRMQAEFDEFLEKIEQAIRSQLSVDQVFRTQDARIIRPTAPVRSRRSNTDKHDSCDPVYHDYHGMDDHFYYCWVWSEMCHAHQIHCADCKVVDEEGEPIAELGEDGIEAGESDLMNPEADLEVPSNVAVESPEQESNEASKIASPPELDTSDNDSKTSGGGWFDSFTDAFSSDSSGGSDGGSSCGSSCGGGCGGD
ncbi:MAG: hypothetical protein AB8B91_03960 [Rubripirellula sp.]